MKIRVPWKLLLVATLGACGAPGSEGVFTKGNPKVDPKAAVPGTPETPVPRPAPQPIQTKRFVGVYRRLGDESRFQECRSNRALDIFGPFDVRRTLQDRMRFSSAYPGQRHFAVFEGAVVTDSVRGQAPDTARVPRTRFFLLRIDTLRTWERTDCGGWRPTDG